MRRLASRIGRKPQVRIDPRLRTAVHSGLKGVKIGPGTIEVHFENGTVVDCSGLVCFHERRGLIQPIITVQ